MSELCSIILSVNFLTLLIMHQQVFPVSCRNLLCIFIRIFILYYPSAKKIEGGGYSVTTDVRMASCLSVSILVSEGYLGMGDFYCTHTSLRGCRYAF